MARRRERSGTVDSFDHDVGLGAVIDDQGVQHGFHCVEIADGSRRIDVGARVRYRVVPGRLGRWEAAEIQPFRRPERSTPTPA